MCVHSVCMHSVCVYVCVYVCDMYYIYIDIIEISLDDCDKDGLFSLILDGTVCPIYCSPKEIQCYFYSGKHKCHAIKYEIGVHLIIGKLVWIGEPTYEAMHDM